GPRLPPSEPEALRPVGVVAVGIAPANEAAAAAAATCAAVGVVLPVAASTGFDRILRRGVTDVEVLRSVKSELIATVESGGTGPPAATPTGAADEGGAAAEPILDCGNGG